MKKGYCVLLEAVLRQRLSKKLLTEVIPFSLATLIKYILGEIPDLSALNDINSIGDVLKMYFRNLPQKPLLMTKGIKEASCSHCCFIRSHFLLVLTNQSEMVSIMVDELKQIPEVNYFTLKRLFGLFKALTDNANVTKMSAENLSIVFHPTLQIPQTIIVLLINHPEVFSNSVD
jgi:hypothetical protein